ncbi:MAG: hypothetical protein ACR2JG_14075 [Geodermatophilaceae bacterium]
MTLQHIVLFSFPEELSPADPKEMRAQVASWATEIGAMGTLRFGTDLYRRAGTRLPVPPLR